MALKKKKDFDFTAVLTALGGGVAVTMGGDLLEKNIPQLAAKPILTDAGFMVIGLLTEYFGPPESKPFAYGVIGAAGGGLGPQVMDMVDDMIGAATDDKSLAPEVGYLIDKNLNQDIEVSKSGIDAELEIMSDGEEF